MKESIMAEAIAPIGKFILENSPNENISDIAEKLGLTRPYLSSIINGRNTPSIEVAKKIAELYNASSFKVFQLLGWTNLNIDLVMVERIQDKVDSDPYFREIFEIYDQLQTENDRFMAVKLLRTLKK
jgi:transcriptional regulator with XRE-family HTH domain